jgi:putative hemolysin
MDLQTEQFLHNKEKTKMKPSPFPSALMIFMIALTSCTAAQAQPTPVPAPTNTPPANMPNPASVHCEQKGYKLEIRTATDGSQSGVCIFPDGSECDEWAYFRGECSPGSASPTPSDEATLAPTEFPTPYPIDPTDYQGWWTYTHASYSFSIMLPEDWIVEEVTTGDPLMNGHTLRLHPEYASGKENIRMTFRRVGEDTILWPTGVGSGKFIPQGTLEVAGQPARRILFVCPTGEVTEIWYHNAEENQPNIRRGELEFGFIYSYSYCEPGFSLRGKIQRVGEMIIASLKVP